MATVLGGDIATENRKQEEFEPLSYSRLFVVLKALPRAEGGGGV